jgi:lipopolysaccharide export system permease protein
MLKRLDVYILKKFLYTFFFSITLILMIFIVFDVKDKLAHFTNNRIPLREIVFDYYLMFIPYYGNYFSPLFVFISVIFFTSRMAQNTEFIAILSSGASFRRIMRPYIVGAAFLAFASLVLNHFIVPKAFKIKIGFEDKWINKNYNSDARNMHRKIGPNLILYLESYDNKLNTGYRISLEKVVDNKQTYFLSADKMTWDSTGKEWVLTGVRERKIISQDRLDTIRNQKPIYKQSFTSLPEKRVHLEFAPIDMWRDESKIETKTFFELNDYIYREKLKGSNRVVLYEVERQRRSSFPFATFILTIIGVSVSSRKVRGGVGLQIALGLFLSCIYIMLMYIFTTITTTGFATPFLGVWTPNIIFSFVALIFYRRAQK